VKIDFFEFRSREELETAIKEMEQRLFDAFQIPKERLTPSITCLHCGMTSYNINDVRNRYCGNCHIFLE
jgi:hypothetical protein